MFGWLSGLGLGDLDRGPATVVAVYDGDTCTCTRPFGKPFQVRLHGIDAPELRDAYGETARYMLATLIHNRRVILVPSEYDRYRRVVARVLLDGVDISVAMLRAGHAFHFLRYDSSPELAKAEATARRRRLGLWGMPWAEARRLEYERSAAMSRSGSSASETEGCLMNCLGLVVIAVAVAVAMRSCSASAPRVPVVAPEAEPPVVPAPPQADQVAPVRPSPERRLPEQPAERPEAVARPVQQPPERVRPPAPVDPVDAARWRTWTSADGRFNLRAKFVQATNGRMTLLREDGKRIVVDLERLCEDDVDFVRKQKWLQAGRKPRGD